MEDFNGCKMQKSDLKSVVSLLSDDDIGQWRGVKEKVVHPDYIRTFEQISNDANQYAAVFEINGETIGCL